MVIVKTWGGIGNQLFQYVFGEYIRFRFHQDVFYDDNAFVSVDKLRKKELDVLKGDIVYDNRCTFSKYRGAKNRLLRYFFQFNPYHHFIKEGSSSLPSEFKDDHLYFFQGYWQDVKYYNWLKENVSDFNIEFKHFPDELAHLKQMILSEDNTLSVHIRRGDYFKPENIGTYGVCDADYFHRSLEFFQTKISNFKIYVFSDDLEWVKENIDFGQEVVYVPNYDIPQFAYIELMSFCHHHIISNSSFSWWGAVLNKRTDEKVVCPKRWKLTSDKTIAVNSWHKL